MLRESWENAIQGLANRESERRHPCPHLRLNTKTEEGEKRKVGPYRRLRVEVRVELKCD